MDFGMETLTWFQALTTSFLSDVERWSPLDLTIIGVLTELNYVFLRFNYWWKRKRLPLHPMPPTVTTDILAFLLYFLFFQ